MFQSRITVISETTEGKVALISAVSKDLVAKGVSASDAVLFMLTTSLSQDLYKRFVHPEATDTRVLLVKIASTAVVTRMLGGTRDHIIAAIQPPLCSSCSCQK